MKNDRRIARKLATGLDSAAVEALARPGTTERSAASRASRLLASRKRILPRVLVPVRLDALVVRAGDQRAWADVGARVVGAGGRLERVQVPEPFTSLPPRPAGVHLHWGLPDALASGADTGGKLTVRAVPDRWLVVRLHDAPSGKRRRCQGWVIEAEHLVPVVKPLEDWRPGAHGAPISALGPGGVAWAAVYDSALNRFAFYDAVDPEIRGPLTYLVCGWHADADTDPLHGVRSEPELQARLAQLRWSLGRPDAAVDERRKQDGDAVEALVEAYGGADGTAEGRSVLRRDPALSEAPLTEVGGILVHGHVVGIGWPRATTAWDSEELGGPPPAGAVEVVYADTVNEALATLLADPTTPEDETRLVEAFTLGCIEELDGPDGEARLDVRLHDETFVSESGGFETLPNPEPPHEGPAAAPQAPRDVAPGVFARARETDQPLLRAAPAVAAKAAGVATGAKASTGMHPTIHRVAVEPLGFVGAGATFEKRRVPAARPSHVRRPLPRFYHPAPPVLALRGAGRSYKNGGDGRYRADGTLACRREGSAVRGVTAQVDAVTELTVSADAVLDEMPRLSALPQACLELFHEVVALDPGSARAVVDASRPGTKAGALGGAPSKLKARAEARARSRRALQVEQTAVLALRDPRVDRDAVLAASGVAGTLPSPVAMSVASRPWVPVYLEWQVAWRPSARGVAAWTLGEIDFAPRPGEREGEPVVIRGRSLVNDRAPARAADAIRKAVSTAEAAGPSGSRAPPDRDGTTFLGDVADEIARALEQLEEHARTEAERAGALDLAQRVEDVDLVTAALDGLYERLGPVRAGRLTVERLRLVDAFGQVLDLPTPSVLVAAAASGPTPGSAYLPPRILEPCRLHFRLLDRHGAPAGDTASPIAGWLVPDHLDGGLEVFDAEGANLGSLRPDADAGLVWEDAPGRPSGLGSSPRAAIADPDLAGILEGLLQWGVADATTGGRDEYALSALARLIDAALWAMDPFAGSGEEHHALLVGHPVAVVRAELRLEGRDHPAPADTLVPVRLGALTHWKDGLFGAFVDRDYLRFVAVDPAATSLARSFGRNTGYLDAVALTGNFHQAFADDLGAKPATRIDHPYVVDGPIQLVPGRTTRVTLLLEPHASVHATTGLLPRKEIALRREWCAPALARLAPSFRFGPVLVEPKNIRMPTSSERPGAWSWDHRAEVARWETEEVTPGNDRARLSATPAEATEGWLRFHPAPKT